jgi:ATP-dependent Clp protease ATP-binding subunit ClpA
MRRLWARSSGTIAGPSMLAAGKHMTCSLQDKLIGSVPLFHGVCGQSKIQNHARFVSATQRQAPASFAAHATSENGQRAASLFFFSQANRSRAVDPFFSLPCFHRGMASEPGRRTVNLRMAASPTASLSKYGRDLTEAARNGQLDPVIGRDEIVRRCLQVFSTYVDGGAMRVRFELFPTF